MFYDDPVKDGAIILAVTPVVLWLWYWWWCWRRKKKEPDLLISKQLYEKKVAMDQNDDEASAAYGNPKKRVDDKSDDCLVWVFAIFMAVLLGFIVTITHSFWRAYNKNEVNPRLCRGTHKV